MTTLNDSSRSGIETRRPESAQAHATQQRTNSQDVLDSGPAGSNGRHLFSRRNQRLIVICVVAVVASGIVWRKVVKPRVMPKRFGVVVPGQIYRSGQNSKWMIEKVLVDNHIAVIVDMNGIEKNDPHQQEEIEVAERLGIELQRFPMAGNGTGDIRNYAKAIRTLRECRQSGKSVLIHCSAGSQRTGGVVAAYRVLVLQESPGLAYDELLRYAWNPRTDQILLTFLNGHMEELAGMLVEMGIIDRVPNPLPFVGP